METVGKEYRSLLEKQAKLTFSYHISSYRAYFNYESENGSNEKMRYGFSMSMKLTQLKERVIRI